MQENYNYNHIMLQPTVHTYAFSTYLQFIVHTQYLFYLLVLYKIYCQLFTLVATYITFCPINGMHLK